MRNQNHSGLQHLARHYRLLRMVALRKQDLQAVLRQCSADTKIVNRNGQASRGAQPESLESATSGAAL
eukprot:COSAG02_NODE_4915_length_4837_cov_6.226467_4_plen_68_part_00